MRTKIAVLPSYVARTTKYAWVVVATLIVTLVLWGFIAAPRVFATDMIGPSSFPSEAAAIDHFVALQAASRQTMGPSSFPSEAAAISHFVALQAASRQTMGSTESSDLPFGLQSGLVTAHLNPSGMVATRLDLIGGTGLPFGLESGLVTAHLDSSGLMATRGTDADTARWVALGEHYIASVQRGIDTDSARYQAVGDYYMAKAGDDLLATSPDLLAAGRQSSSIPYTDVSKFYVERIRAQSRLSSSVATSPDLLAAGRQSSSIPYTDVSRFYVERMRAQASQTRLLAENPELVYARAYMVGRDTVVACSLAQDDATLAANPELRYSAQAEDC